MMHIYAPMIFLLVVIVCLIVLCGIGYSNTLQYLHLINLKFNSNYRHTAIIYCNYLIYVLLLFEERRLRRYSIEMVKTSHTATIYS